MTPERFLKIKDMLSRRQSDLTIVMEEVHKSHNLAAMVRTCDAMGIHSAHAVIPKKGYRDFNGTAKGSGRWVDVSHYDNVESCITKLRGEGKRIVCAHLSEEAVDYREEDYTKPMAVLFGQELYGVTDKAAGLVDGHIIIPMMGMVESYNVSVSAAIILSEAQRQRQNAGMYDSQSLNDKDFANALFKFSYPRQAAQYDAEDKPYPELDDEGNVLG